MDSQRGNGDPEKVIPRAINQIPIRVLLFYVGALLIIMSIYPWNAIVPTESPFVQVFAAVVCRDRHRELRGTDVRSVSV